MNTKIRLLAVASLVAVMASGCSSYRGASQLSPTAGTSGGLGSGQVARTGQVAGTGQVFGQQSTNNVVVNDSCAACAASKAQNTYTYKPAAPTSTVQTKPAPVPQAQAGQYNQQYYINRWNQQQAQAGQAPQAPKPVVQNQQATYTGYGQAPQTPQPPQSNTTYYDYSSAAQANTSAPAATTAASNKSIYTGSYQQKAYEPTTYAGGTAAATNTVSSATSAVSAGGSNYVVKKGDTVFEIMRQTGVYWKDIISINSLSPPYSISPGQNIRLK